MKLKTVIFGGLTIRPNGVAMVKTKQKSPSSPKGFETSIPQTVEGRIVLLVGCSEVIVAL